MPAGYPPGTKCVITRTTEKGHNRLGAVVCVGPNVVTWRSGHPCIVEGWGQVFMNGWSEGNGMLVQDTQTISKDDNGNSRLWVHPVDWMRPIDQDTDADDLYVILGLTDKLPAVV